MNAELHLRPLMNHATQWLSAHSNAILEGIIIGVAAAATWALIELVITSSLDAIVRKAFIRGIDLEIRGRSPYSESMSRVIVRNNTRRTLRIHSVRLRSDGAGYRLIGHNWDDDREPQLQRIMYPESDTDWRYPEGINPYKGEKILGIDFMVGYEDHRGRERFIKIAPKGKFLKELASTFEWPEWADPP
ncbi:MAG: hypothetical protein M9935_00795 [Kiritimatiellae bacterium]|nr:hypothetical protein [Kiritimatiellia bacterium]